MSEFVDARGRKYLTQPERERFDRAAHSHSKPAVQTLSRQTANRQVAALMRSAGIESP